MIEPRLTAASSADGTLIGYWTSGVGPPLVMVHGTSADHLSWEILRPHLEPSFTIHAMDRRGRLASGDHPEYSLEREYQDVTAVVDDVARATDSDVFVFGHSFGGTCALMATRLTDKISRMVVYEPPLSDLAVLGSEFGDRLRAELDHGHHDRVLEIFYEEVVGLDAETITMFRSLPTWPVRAAAAHTLVREYHSDLAIDNDTLCRIAIPVEFVLGGESSPLIREDTLRAAAAVPDSHIEVLEGQTHIAHYAAPDRLAAAIGAFLLG